MENIITWETLEKVKKHIELGWFLYIVIHRRRLCGFIVGGQWWIKSFLFENFFSASVISYNK